MTAIEIMEQVKAVEQIEYGKAMYYTPHEDRVVIGNDACQPSNTICLRVGPDHISNLDIGAIEANVVETLAHWSRR